MHRVEPQRHDEGELTHGQRQIWVGQRLNPDSPLYNMAFAWIFPKALDVDTFRRAWRRVVDGSDALRTVIIEGADGEVRRRVASSEAADEVAPVQRIEPVTAGGESGETAFQQWCRDRCARPLDLSRSLVDCVLVPLPGGRTGWYLNLHHLISDAWSTVLLYRQVAAEYAALTGTGEAPRPLAAYYPTADALAAKTRTRPTATEHWARRSQGSRRVIPLYGRDGSPSATASRRWTLHLDGERAAALDGLCAEEGFLSLSREMSRFAVFATLLVSWLHRVSGTSSLGFDAPIGGRPNAVSKRALGLFIEMFPYAVEVSAEETFRSLGEKCLAEAQLFLSHALPGTSAPSAASASNVVLNYFPESFGEFAGESPRVEWVHPGHGDQVHALRLQVHDFNGSGGLTFHFDFNRGVLPEGLQRRGLRHFEALLIALLDDPDQPIAAVDILTGDERRALEALHGSTPPALPKGTLVDGFLAQARQTPERIALRQGKVEWTFRDLEARSAALAVTLVAEGVSVGDRVAIVARRSAETVAAILGVLRAGAAYVPIDMSAPPGRVADMVEDCGARRVLVGEGCSFAAAMPIAEAIRQSQGQGLRRPPPTVDDLAYVLYTSGSSGRPKGVLVPHGGVADYLAWAERHYVRGRQLRFPLFTSLAFDLTVTSLFLPLITGGTLVVYGESAGPVDTSLMDVVEDNGVDFIKLTPSHLALWCHMDVAASAVRSMVVGGEDFKSALASDVDTLMQGRVEIYNEYGPTEAVVGCVVHRFDPQVDTAGSVPIGVPVDHVRLEILNHALTPVPEGVPGELWVARYGLARGYLGNQGMTAERFAVRPDGDGDGLGDRRYRTGDRVRLVDGTKLAYLGRLDRQLKVSGLRIEPGEIEAALQSLPGIDQCAVISATPTATARPPGGSVESPTYCIRCGLPSNHPQGAMDRQGVCRVCRVYEATREHAQAYFKTLDDLRQLFAESRRKRQQNGLSEGSTYDCLMLFSGGKDSTYALCQLVELGLSVYAFTLDNGFISEGAKNNVRKVAEQLGVPVEFATTPAMNDIFRDSLERFSNVCQGCFKTIYTLSTQRARALGIPIVVTGLSRGQMFETRLTEEMFRDGRRSAEEVDAAVLAARKVYHRVDDAVSRSLDVEIFRDDTIFEEVQFVDFYRYCDVGLSEVLSYLRRRVPWVRPEDTGRSTNCLINDVGIYVHQRREGFHNYALPYSWDVRMGHKTREQAHDELHDQIDVGFVRRTLVDIGCDVEAMTTDRNHPRLVAYYVASEDIADDEVRRQLAQLLPSSWIPHHFQRLDAMPLNDRGKVDEGALPAVDMGQRSSADVRPPEGPVEEFLAELWRQRLSGVEVGGDDHFFQLGGTSLGAMDVMLRLCREFDVDLPLETLFAHPTLSGLARVVEDRILADVADLTDDERQDLLSAG